ncbi:hypothetical protein S83_012270, partial [Arachis hypogaea]
QDIRTKHGINIIDEQKVQMSKVNKKCDKYGHGEATFYTRQMKGKSLSTHVSVSAFRFKRTRWAQ